MTVSVLGPVGRVTSRAPHVQANPMKPFCLASGPVAILATETSLQKSHRHVGSQESRMEVVPSQNSSRQPHPGLLGLTPPAGRAPAPGMSPSVS